ncbi:MAG: FAD-binding oxidoreductase [Nodosilinea sp.]
MNEIADILISRLGAEQVVALIQQALPLGTPLSPNPDEERWPQAAVYPKTEAQLAEVMACAHQHHWRVLPCGSGTKLNWGGLVNDFEVIIGTNALNTIIDHAVGDMTLTAEAGLRLGDLRPILAQAHQFLAIDPAFPDQATLGGIVATADTGSLRQRYGGVRDMLIGLSFVRHDGQVAKAGGRVVKNVAGYDLMKLMTGSYGTLGILSQLTFRLYPIQDVSKTVLVSGAASVIRPLADALRRSSLTPVALDLLSPGLANRLGYPNTFTLAARFQSIAPGVDEQVNHLLGLIPSDLTPALLTGSEEAEFWQRAGEMLFFDPATDGASPANPEVVIAKIGVRPTVALEVLEKLLVFGSPASLGRIHASSGIGTLQLQGAWTTAAAITTLRGLCAEAGGYLTVLQAPKALKRELDVWGYDGSALELMKTVKRQFDPLNILSPGRFVGGI